MPSLLTAVVPAASGTSLLAVLPHVAQLSVDPVEFLVEPVQLLVAPVPGTVGQFVGTFVAGWLVFAFTAHAAATYVLGDVPWKRAAVVGVVPAAVTVALIRYSPLVIVAVTLAADVAAVHAVYRVKYRTTALVVVMHYVVTLAVVLLVANLLALLGTAPG